MEAPAFIAGGNILPATFVRIDSTKAQPTVIQASAATQSLIGISQAAAKEPPIPQLSGTQWAAVDGDNITVHQVGQPCLLQLGSGGCTAGDRLTSDGSGKGVVASGTNVVGAIALQTGAAGEFVRVRPTDPMLFV